MRRLVQRNMLLKRCTGAQWAVGRNIPLPDFITSKVFYAVKKY